MKTKELIKELQKLDPETEVYFTNYGTSCPVEEIVEGYYVENEFDGPEVIACGEEEKEDYGIEEDQDKVAMIV